MEKSVVKLKNKSIKINYKELSRNIDFSVVMVVCVGFFLSRAILMDTIAPLGLAFFLYISRIEKYRLPVFISTLIGVVLSNNVITYVMKYCVCLVIYMSVNKKLKLIDSKLKVALLGAFVLFPISVGQAFLADRYLYDILLAVIESSIMFIAVYIFSYGIDLLVSYSKKITVNIEEIISLSIIVTLSIMGVGEITILGVSLRIVLSTILILVSSIVGGATFGATSGVVVGIAFIVSNVTNAIYMGVFSVAGIISGAFNRLNKYVCIIGYILTWVMMYVYSLGIGINTNQIRDMLIGCLIVLILPKSLFSKIGKIAKSDINSNEVVNDYMDRMKDLTNNRLINMSKAYDSIADTFDQIREKEKVIDKRDIAGIIDMIYNDQCRKCGMKRRCWDSKFNYTYTLMSDILGIIEDEGKLEVENIPGDFTKECIDPEEVVKTINTYYKLFLVDYNWTLRFSESRKLISNQIRSISKSIKSISNDLENNIVLNLEKENDIKEELERNYISINNINYINKDNDDFEIVINKRTCSDGCLCDKKLTEILSEYMQTNVSPQKIGCRSMGQECKITFSKSQKHKAVTEVVSMSKDGHILCGDNFTHMDISDSKYMMAISDGMGKGRKAYEESSITIDILEKMMDAKIEDEIVINTINNILLLKSLDEMFSTLDLGIVDLKRGVLETIKMGACPTYIKRDNNDIDLISSSSLPVGILSDIKLDRKTTKIKNGDYIIMVSDGILDAGKNKNLGDNWLIYFIKEITTTNPKEIANQILDKAFEMQGDVIEDDMTVLITKIYEN